MSKSKKVEKAPCLTCGENKTPKEKLEQVLKVRRGLVESGKTIKK